MEAVKVLPIIAIPPCNSFVLGIDHGPEIAFATPTPIADFWFQGAGNPEKNAPKAYAARIPYSVETLCEIVPEGPVWAVYGLEFDGATIATAAYTDKIIAARAPIHYISKNYPELFGGPAAPTVVPGRIPTAHGDIFLLPVVTNYNHAGPSSLATDLENAVKKAAQENRPIVIGLYYEVRTRQDAQTLSDAFEADPHDWPQALLDKLLYNAMAKSGYAPLNTTPDEVATTLNLLDPDDLITIEPTASLNWEACRLQDLFYSWLGNQSSAPYQHAYACGLRAITSLITATNIQPPLPNARARFYSNISNNVTKRPLDYYFPAPTFLLDEATIVHHLNNAARGYIVKRGEPTDLYAGTDVSDPDTYHNVIRNFEKSVNRCIHPLDQ